MSLSSVILDSNRCPTVMFVSQYCGLAHRFVFPKSKMAHISNLTYICDAAHTS